METETNNVQVITDFLNDNLWKIFNRIIQERRKHPTDSLISSAFSKIAGGLYFRRDKLSLNQWKPIKDIADKLNFAFDLQGHNCKALVVTSQSINVNRKLYADPNDYLEEEKKYAGYKPRCTKRAEKIIAHCACCGTEFLQEFQGDEPLRGYDQEIFIGCKELNKTKTEHVSFCSDKCERIGDLRIRTNNC